MGSMKLARANGGSEIISSVRNNVFPDGTIGDGSTHALLEVRNAHPTLSTVGGGKLWVSVAVGGGTFAVAIADGTARAMSYTYSFVDAATLSYSVPTTQATGLVLPTLAAGQKMLIGARMNLVGATQAWPESNIINLGFTVPIGFS